MKNDLKLLAGLPNLELLSLASQVELGKTYFGFDQEWYQGSWQRRAGCGPCTAATILYYLARTQPELAALYPYPASDQASFLLFMDLLWQYVTPGLRGVNEPAMLTDGIKDYAASIGLALASQTFPVPADQKKRRPLADFSQFIETGLARQSPVAFLNLSNGQLSNLESWHWVTLTALYQPKEAGLLAEISDSGSRKMVDLALWYGSSQLGGAVCYIHS